MYPFFTLGSAGLLRVFVYYLYDVIPALFSPHNLADLILVFILVYTVLKFIRGTRAVPMGAGIATLLVLYWASVRQALTTLEFILRGALLYYLPVVIIVLFQAEIRQALTTLGNQLRLPFLIRQKGQFGEGLYDEIVLAATTLSSTKTGALIVIERSIGLRNVADGGVQLDADLSYDLLVTIFNPATPLHDGAVIVRQHRVAAAACFLPLTLDPRLSKDLGTRHRAAIGITEDSDAVAVVVSEETGLISFVEGGNLRRGLDATRLRSAIIESIKHSAGSIADRILPREISDEKLSLTGQSSAPVALSKTYDSSRF